MLYKITVGTTSESKLKFLKECLDEIGIEAELLPSKVESKVAEQPMTEEETSFGAENRAKGALLLNPNADFGIGMEVGYNSNKNGGIDIFSCTAIVDNNGFKETCFSSKMPLPKYHKEVLRKQLYLGDYVRDFLKNIDKPEVNYLREYLRSRRQIITESIRNILLRYLNREEY